MAAKTSKKTSKKPSKPSRRGMRDAKKTQRKPRVETAAARIAKAEALLRELRKLEADTEGMVEKLSDAKFHFKRKDYKRSISLCNKAMKTGNLSKRTKKARDSASELLADVKKMSKEGYDMSETFEILEATGMALADSNLKAFRSLLSEAKKTMNLAKQTRKIQKDLDVTKNSVADLKEKGSITLESEILLSEAGEALRQGDVRKAKDLTRAVKKWIDIEILEKERHELLTTQDQKEISERMTNLNTQLEEFRKLGIDTSWMEASITNASEALDEGDSVRAKRFVLELEESMRSLRGSSIRAARETIERAADKIEEARRQNIGVLVAERSLSQAEKAFVRGEFKDAIDFAQLAISFVKRSIGRKISSGTSSVDEDYSRALIDIGKMVSEKSEPAEEPPDISSEGRRLVDDSLSELESTYLTLRAQEDLESIRTAIDEADAQIAGVNEAKIMLRKAQDAFKVENYAAVTVLERTVRDLLVIEKSKKGKSAA